MHAHAVFALAVLAAPALAQEKVDFARDVRPIFERRCYECHGPDEQEADLRFDRRESVLPEGGSHIVVPGDPDASEVVVRISLPIDDPDVMPNEGDLLTQEQIGTVRRWIEEGAIWPVDVEVDEVEAEPVAPLPLLPELDAAAIEARDRVLEAVQERGGAASTVAGNSQAADINLSLLGRTFVDTDLEVLDGAEASLAWLSLARTGVTDAGLAKLRSFGELRRLDLSRTEVGDDGLRHLSGLLRLEYLNLYGTGVTDAGLDHLRGLTELRKLFVWNTGVTDAGALALREAIPGLAVDRGGYAEQIAAVARAETPENDTCPLTGKPVVPAYVATHDERKVGFCCEKCRASFLVEPEKYTEAVEKVLGEK